MIAHTDILGSVVVANVRHHVSEIFLEPDLSSGTLHSSLAVT